jgi:hypothetical protein
MVWDFTCRDTLAPSYTAQTSSASSAAASAAERDKKRKYAEINSYHFIPIGAETLGPWGPEASCFLNELGDKLIVASQEKRAKEFLFQRLSMAIVRGNSSSILNTLPTFRTLDEMLLF